MIQASATRKPATVDAAERDPMRRDRVKIALLAWSLGGLLLGLAVRFGVGPALAGPVWLLAVLPVLGALVIEILRSLRKGEVGLDIVAAPR